MKSAERSTVQRRSDFKAEISRALRAALAHCDMIQADLADECGVSPTLVGKWLDANREETPSLADLAMFRPELAQAMYPLLTRSHGVTLVKRVAADATTADHFVRFSELATLTASVTTEYASALSDGHVDLVEEKRVASAITKLRDAADSHLCAIGARQRGLKAVS